MTIRYLLFSARFVVTLIVALVSNGLFALEPDLKAPLPVDPNIKMGALPNGMNYWIRAHKTPPGKINAWLHVNSGSLNEDDNQRGLAHFLEHMAFNGSENFPPGTLVKYFESIGLRFGHDQNAFTGFDQTTYILSLPDIKPETLNKGLQYLADVAFRISLPPNEIEKERGVVLEEFRARKSAQQRVIDKLLPILAPGSRLAERMPIGKEEIIKSADRKLVADYYTKWYRPDNTTLLIVGDLDPTEVEKSVAANFTGWKESANNVKNADPGVKPYNTIRASVITDPELTETEVSVCNVGPLVKLQTIGEYRQRQVESIGSWILNRRLTTLVEKGAAPFQRANVSVSPFLNVCKYVNGEASGKPEQWEPMLLALLTEIKRAREFGFLEQELEDARKQTMASVEQSARTEGTWDARAFLARMNNAIAQEQKPMSEAQRLELTKHILPTIKLEEVSAAFKQNFAPNNRLLLVTMPEKADLKAPTETEILNAGAKAEAGKVEALAVQARPKSLLEQDPQPGAVSDQEEEKDLKILSVTLNNGVRVHLRSMDFKKDQVSVQINLAGGAIRETAANRGITEVAALALQQAATQKFSSTLIREMMTGKNVNVSGMASDDMLTLRISGSPKDLEEGFRLAYLLLTEGKIEDTALKLWKEKTLQNLAEQKTSVEAQLAERLQNLLMNDDPRGRALTS
ncbi:MAG: insulinase family protein, partial [Planctomycetota bacterium]